MLCEQIRLQLRAAEEQIILRSRAVEMQWSSDKCQQSVKGMCNFVYYSCLLYLGPSYRWDRWHYVIGLSIRLCMNLYMSTYVLVCIYLLVPRQRHSLTGLPSTSSDFITVVCVGDIAYCKLHHFCWCSVIDICIFNEYFSFYLLNYLVLSNWNSLCRSGR